MKLLRHLEGNNALAKPVYCIMEYIFHILTLFSYLFKSVSFIIEQHGAVRICSIQKAKRIIISFPHSEIRRQTR